LYYIPLFISPLYIHISDCSTEMADC